MKELSKKVNMPELLDSINSPHYFNEVEKALLKIYPELEPAERIKKRRAIYFNRVIEIIKKEPEKYKNQEIINYLKQQKEKFQIAIITSNTHNFLNDLIEIYWSDFIDLFDLIEFSKADEKDEKNVVFERFIQKNGKPEIYMGDDKKSTYEFCKKIKFPASL